MKSDGKKKQVPLRLSEPLWNDLAEWAEDEFRSINGQIEYLLTQCVKERKGKGSRKPAKENDPYSNEERT